MNEKNKIVILLVLFIGLSACTSNVAAPGSMQTESSHSVPIEVSEQEEKPHKPQVAHPVKVNTGIESTIESTSIYDKDEWIIKVKWDSGSVSEDFAPGGMTSQFRFEGLSSTMMATAFPVTKNTYRFYQEWDVSVQTMTEMLYEMAGESGVNFLSHDQIYSPDGNTYVFYFELWMDEHYVPVTMAWRFCQSYYLFVMGVNLGDMPEMFELCKNTARDFVDETSGPLTGRV